MQALAPLFVAVLVLASADAMAACEAAFSDGRVTYGKSTQKSMSSILVCSGKSQAVVRDRSPAISPEGSVYKSSAGLSDSHARQAESVAIITRELLRSRDQLNVIKAPYKGGSVDLDAVKRLESDVEALESELKRLARNTP